MACFIDDPNIKLPEDARYLELLHKHLPGIKEDEICIKCLAEHEEMVKYTDCPLVKERHEQGLLQ